MNYLPIGKIKFFKMKRIVLVFLLSFLLTACPTEDFPKNLREYQIKNESGKDLILKFLHRTVDTLEFKVNLENKAIYVGGVLKHNDASEIRLSDPESFYPSMAFHSRGLGSDSLVVLFNKERYSLKWIKDDPPASFSKPIDRNPFRHGNYEEVKTGVFQFSISEQDYENAEDCNGDCE